MSLSIVILNYKTPELVLDCIKSLEKNYSEELNRNYFEIIVVDNNSVDGSMETFKKYSQNRSYIELVENSQNLGFGKGSNIGAQNSKGDFILFLNSDTQVEDRGLTKMIEFMKNNNKVGILGGRLKNPDGTPQASAGRFYTLLNFLIMCFGGQRLGLLKSSPTGLQKVDWVSGACMMVNREKFDRIGGFDEDIFMYMEDMDLSYRAMKQNVQTFFYPDILVKHKGEGSSNRGFAVINIYKGLLSFYKKQMPAWQYYVVKFSLWLKAAVVYIIGRLTNNNYYTSTYAETFKLFR